MRINDASGTWRLIYRVDADAIVIAEVFAKKTGATPKAVLGDIAGAPGKLPYSKEVHDYMRLLAKSTPRAKLYTIGTVFRNERPQAGRKRHSTSFLVCATSPCCQLPRAHKRRDLRLSG